MARRCRRRRRRRRKRKRKRKDGYNQREKAVRVQKGPVSGGAFYIGDGWTAVSFLLLFFLRGVRAECRVSIPGVMAELVDGHVLSLLVCCAVLPTGRRCPCLARTVLAERRRVSA